MQVKYGKPSTEDPKPLSPQNMKDWNNYVAWLEKKGMKGSKELDKKEVSFEWLEKFRKENPETSLTREHIPQVQTEVQKLADNARAFAARKGDPNSAQLMTGTSKFDGIPGSKTTSFTFPNMTEKSYHNDALVSKQNLGLVGGDLKPTGQTSAISSNRPTIPKESKLERLSDGVYYENKNGDLVKVGGY